MTDLQTLIFIWVVFHPYTAPEDFKSNLRFPMITIIVMNVLNRIGAAVQPCHTFQVEGKASVNSPLPSMFSVLSPYAKKEWELAENNFSSDAWDQIGLRLV